MRKYINFWVLVVCFCLIGTNGYALVPWGAGISPGHPTIHNDINIEITLRPCETYLPSDPDFYHLSSNNHITFVFIAYPLIPCHGGQLSFEKDIGSLAAGEYTLQAYTVGHPSDLPNDINDPLGAPFGTLVQFTVYAPAAPVPALGLWGMLLIIGSMLLSLLLLRKKKLWLTAGLLLFCGSLSAKEFIILLSNQAGAPSPEQVVNQSAISPPPPSYLLDSFNNYTPDAGDD